MKNCPVCSQKLPFEIGVRIRAHRYSKGLSVAQLADMCGLDRSTIMKIEKGERLPRPETIKTIREALSLEVL